MTAFDSQFEELIAKYVEDYPDDFYEQLLLGPMTSVYSARKTSPCSDWMAFSNLLIDKFASHSLSFFHLSQGIVERRSDDTIKKAKGYDLFTVNALFRVMMETYIAFNWIFVAPRTNEEKEFRFLLWKLDGLFEKRKFEYTPEIEQEFAAVFAKDEADKQDALARITNNGFYQLLDPVQIARVLDAAKHKANWKYEWQANNILRPLKITELIQMTCRMDAFLNMYRYASLYTHSNYASIDKFKQMRGKPVPDDYAEPLIKLAVYLTTLLIDDMCTTDHNAARAFAALEPFFQSFITKMSAAIRKIPVRPVK
jgi:hypothetical protein